MLRNRREFTNPLVICTSDLEALARYYVTTYWQAEWVKKLRRKTGEENNKQNRVTFPPLPPPPLALSYIGCELVRQLLRSS